jgi:hypothetical protein
MKSLPDSDDTQNRCTCYLRQVVTKKQSGYISLRYAPREHRPCCKHCTSTQGAIKWPTSIRT